MRRTPLKRTSKKNAAAERELAAARKRVIWRANGMCEAGSPVCPPEGRHAGAHVHHIQERSDRVNHSDDNLRYVCEKAHDWIHTHTREAITLGLLRSRHSPI